MSIGLVHDAGGATTRHGRLLQAFHGCDVIAYGHTHLPEISWMEDKWIVNPGSERRRAPEHTLIVLESGEPTLVSLSA
jgi:predicted phosphodiesterase